MWESVKAFFTMEPFDYYMYLERKNIDRLIKRIKIDQKDFRVEANKTKE